MVAEAKKGNQAKNPYCDFMREAAPGDGIFSFCGKRIPVIGVAQSHTYEAPQNLCINGV